MKGRMVSVFLGMLTGGFAVGAGAALYMHWDNGIVINSVAALLFLVLSGVAIMEDVD